MPFEIVRNDITRMQVDCIVNAANSRLRMGGGVCGAIFEAAGPQPLQAACDVLSPCPVGSTVITPGFDLYAHWVIHAVGPIWEGGSRNEASLLRSAYLSSLTLAEEHGIRSIAFPLISSGIYGYPKDEALSIALSAIQDFLLEHEDMDVYLVVFDRKAFVLSEKLDRAIQSYIDEKLVDRFEAQQNRRQESESFNVPLSFAAESAPKSSKKRFSFPKFGHSAHSANAIKADPPEFPSDAEASCLPEECAKDTSSVPVDFDAPSAPYGDSQSSDDPLALLDAQLNKRIHETFAEAVLRLTDEKGFLKDSEVYKRANLDKSVFSRLRSNRDYVPSRSTALALAIALRLNPDETSDLLALAGFALSPTSTADIIVSFFLQHRIYDIYQVNAALFQHGQTCLGAKMQ